jgi:biotin carboxyl carrier protein
LKLKITVDGKLYEVEVEVAEPETPRPGYVPPLGQARVAAVAPAPPSAAPSQAPVADEAKVCRSPLAGVVSRVAVKPGDAIGVNDILIVLEAMKMETVVTAPFAGTVSRVNAGEGDGVQQGQVLVEFE